MSHRTVVIYAYHHYCDRTRYFLENAPKNNDATFYLMDCSGDDSLVVPSRFIHIKHENKGFDFGAWSVGLLKHQIVKQDFDNFIFVNTSVFGPYSVETDWVEHFISLLRQNNVHLSGCTINNSTVLYGKHPHVQSYVFAATREAVEYLIRKEIFSLSNMANSKDEAIYDKEILMSRFILENNWNIACFMEPFIGVDWLQKPKNLTEGDLMYLDFCWTVWSPLDTIFFKGNRMTIQEVKTKKEKLKVTPSVSLSNLQSVRYGAGEAYTVISLETLRPGPLFVNNDVLQVKDPCCGVKKQLEFTLLDSTVVVVEEGMNCHLST